MDKCFNCGKYGHKQRNCPEPSSKDNLKKCYDCGTAVPDIKTHRSVCPQSRYSKSAINPVNLSSPVVIVPCPQSGRLENVDETSTLLLPPVNKLDHTDFYFLIDVSGSMKGFRLDTAKTCAKDIVQKMDPLDRMAIITFDTNPYFKLKPRPVEEILRKKELESILDRIFADGLTAIYDAIYLAVSQLHNKNQRTTILVLTDGEDNSSKHSYDEVTKMLTEYPNITLSIIHVDEYNKPNSNYINLCSQNRGKYVLIKETEIKITVEHLFNTFYIRI